MIALIGKILLVDDIFCDLRHAELLLDGTSRDEDHHCILLLGKNEAWMMIDDVEVEDALLLEIVFRLLITSR